MENGNVQLRNVLSEILFIYHKKEKPCSASLFVRDQGFEPWTH